MAESNAAHACAPALSARGLTVRTRAGAELVHAVDLSVRPGGRLGVVGESGSGKTLTLRACLGVLPCGLVWRADELVLAGTDALALASARRPAHATGAGNVLGACATQTRGFARLLGERVGFVPQNTTEYLHPLMRVRAQMTDGYLAHMPGATHAGALERARELLASVGIRDTRRVLDAYPGELSGGMRQRVNIACALMGSPALVVADEPTAALDAVVARQVAELLVRCCEERGAALVMVSHDLGVVGACCEDLVVMQEGRVVERGRSSGVLACPREPYTRMLVDAARPHPRVRVGDARQAATSQGGEDACVLEARGVSRRFGTLVAVNDVSLALHSGRTVGVVGESGSGKSTLGEILGGLQVPDAGQVLFGGADVSMLRGEARRAFRRGVQFVFQDPVASMNPKFSVARVLADAQRVLSGRRRAEADERSRAMLERVGLQADAVMGRRARELSGGQAQRVAVARALLARPDVLVCDECTSALDVSVQARLLGLLRELQDELGCAMLFVSHDMRVVAQMADEVLVMREGRVVERGSAPEVLEHPCDAYTRTLVGAAFAPVTQGGDAS